jgi:hypothetical protein
MKTRGPVTDDNRISLYLLLLALVCSARVLFFHDIFWDDNCWLQAIYSGDSLREFLDTGFNEMRRVPLGVFLYYFFDLHKLTDHAPLIWQAFNLAMQIGAPLLLYRFVTHLSSGNRTLGAAAAAFMIVLPLDHTLPYLSAINYRVGLLLSILSLLLSDRAMTGNKTDWRLLALSLVAGMTSLYVFTESAIALEPARALLFWYRLRGRGLAMRASLLRAAQYSAGFVAFTLPLIAYKMLYRPYGMYEGIYKSDIWGLLHWKEHARLAFISLRGLWIKLWQLNALATVTTILLAVLATIFAFVVLRRIRAAKLPTKKHPDFQPHVFVALLGLAILLLQHFMFAFAGRPLALGADSSHAALMQIGYAMIGGAVVLYILSRVKPAAKTISAAILAAVVGAGVFFSNLNLDLFVYGSIRQSAFWTVFTARFPNLPPNAVLFVDAVDAIDLPTYYTSDTDNTYDLELYVNLLYATTTDPREFRRYRMLSIDDEFRDWYRQNPTDIEALKPVTRMSHFGRDNIDPRDLIVIRYRNGELLVNDEIVKRYPNEPYAAWARGKPAPILPPEAEYPLRLRAPSFLPIAPLAK